MQKVVWPHNDIQDQNSRCYIAVVYLWNPYKTVALLYTLMYYIQMGKSEPEPQCLRLQIITEFDTT